MRYISKLSPAMRLLPVAAYGPHAANVTGLLDQTDVFYIICDAIKIE